MWMTQYVSEIQRKLIEEYGFEKGANGCPQDVGDGAYPMTIDGKLDLVLIQNGRINCLNLIGTPDGLSEFQNKARKPNQHQKEP